MNRYQLRADFEKSFPYLDHTKQTVDKEEIQMYKATTTYFAWLAWVSSFETYTNEPLTGSYASPTI